MKTEPLSPRSRSGYWLALAWLLLLGAIGLLAPWLALPYAATTPDLQHIATPPATGSAHYLGTDPLGRDMLAGLVAGARRLLFLSLPAVLLATMAGALAGAAAGFWGDRQLRLPTAVAAWGLAIAWWQLALPGTWVVGSLLGLALLLTLATGRQAWRAAWRPWLTFALPLDSLVLGAATLLGAVPRLILLVALVAGPPISQSQLLGLLTLMAWPETARLVRGQMLRVRTLPFIEAARASGLPTSRIWWHHALPHACQPLLAFAPLSLAGLISLESALSFLGIGQGPDVVSWGGVLATVRQDPSAWWVAVFPGLALLITLLALQKTANSLSS
jgi:peptide/nickel transport system permease protein